MKTRNAGITLIEMLSAVVIVGIIAATAVPHYIEMRQQAAQTELDSVAGTAASAMNINYAGCALNRDRVTPGQCQQLSRCAQTADLLKQGMPSGYTLVGADPGTKNGITSTCAVLNPDGLRAEFVAIAAGN